MKMWQSRPEVTAAAAVRVVAIVRGNLYRAVIATPSLPALAANTLVFRAVSGGRRDLLAKPAPLTRIALHALTADSFSYVCRVRSNGRWTLFSTMTFHRVKSAT